MTTIEHEHVITPDTITAEDEDRASAAPRPVPEQRNPRYMPGYYLG